jgi:hypothetical protein
LNAARLLSRKRRIQGGPGDLQPTGNFCRRETTIGQEFLGLRQLLNRHRARTSATQNVTRLTRTPLVPLPGEISFALAQGTDDLKDESACRFSGIKSLSDRAEADTPTVEICEKPHEVRERLTKAIEPIYSQYVTVTNETQEFVEARKEGPSIRNAMILKDTLTSNLLECINLQMELLGSAADAHIADRDHAFPP